MALQDRLHGGLALTIAQPIAIEVQPWTAIMIADKPRAKIQREPRRQLNKRPTWMTMDGTTKTECFVLDVSPGGAKIMTDAEIDIRGRFGLALVAERPKRQPCEVVWRRGNTYGVKFVT